LEPAFRGTPVAESPPRGPICADDGRTESRKNLYPFEKFMKPTPQISPSHQPPSGNFPLTDYSFQPAIEVRTNAAALRQAPKPPAFHQLSTGIFEGRLSRQQMPDLVVFTLITAICAWPIFSALISVIRLVRNY